MKNSLKQLLRTPVKALLFLLLMAASTALLVFGSVLYGDTSSRIDEVEASFTTLGMVEQVPVKTVIVVRPPNVCGWGGGPDWEEIWGERMSVDVLSFEGADYLIPPENHPYYIADIPTLKHTFQPDVFTQRHVVQVVALSDSDPETTTARVQVEKVLTTYNDGFEQLHSNVFSTMKEGKEILVCQCTSDEKVRVPLQKGKSYIVSLWDFYCREHASEMNDEGLDPREYIPWNSPYCLQYDKDGNELPTTYFTHNTRYGLVEEVTEDFWDPGGKGEKWEDWANYQSRGDHLFTVAPIDTLQLIPLFQNHKAHLVRGREITSEEFESGARVCILPDAIFLSAGLELGDKINFSMLSSSYGSARPTLYAALWYDLPLFNAQGDLYEPFWETEYEVVGTYSVVGLEAALDKGMISNDMIVIPAKSVGASDENNISYFGTMKSAQTTFQIKNGSIAEFDAALHEALPDLKGVEVTYNDNGYEDIMESLRTTWITSVLLFTVGLLAAAAILALLLYFFITKQKKRTAIERSLGMSKRQCRVSLMSGILTLTIIAVVLGSVCATVLLDRFAPISAPAAQTSASEIPDAEEASPDTAEETEAAEVAVLEDGETFSTEFSSWVQLEETDFTLKDASAQLRLFMGVGIPCVLILLVFFLSLLLIRHNLKTEPIYLLSSRTDL